MIKCQGIYSEMEDNYTIIEDIFDTKNPQHVSAMGRVRQTPPLPEPFRHPHHPPHHQVYSRDMMMQEPIPQQPSPKIMMNDPSSLILPHEIHCIDAFSHMEECALCSSYFKKDIKFYWFIIFILMMIILLLASKMYDKTR